MRTAARYQRATRGSMSVRTGACRVRTECRPGTANAGTLSALFVIRMPRAKAHTNTLGDTDEFRRLAELQCTLAREIALDNVDDAARPGRHHDDPGRDKHRFRN